MEGEEEEEKQKSGETGVEHLEWVWREGEAGVRDVKEIEN